MKTVSTKRNRVYPWQFDHDECRRLRAEGRGWNDLARHFGVSFNAVKRVCDPVFAEQLHARSVKSLRRTKKTGACKGCGTTIWVYKGRKERTGYCRRCLGAQVSKADVRHGELRCTTCREWKPDSEYWSNSNAAASRRGRCSSCRSCETTKRREYRHRHNEQRKRENDKLRTKKRREAQPMAEYVVIQPNGDSNYHEVGRVEAGSPAHAIEQAALAEGDYIAIPMGRFKIMTAEPVCTFKVVTGREQQEREADKIMGEIEDAIA